MKDHKKAVSAFVNYIKAELDYYNALCDKGMELTMEELIERLSPDKCDLNDETHKFRLSKQCVACGSINTVGYANDAYKCLGCGHIGPIKM